MERTKATEFQRIFDSLRAILRKHAGNLSIQGKDATQFCLIGGRHPKHKTPMPIAWVQIGKAYVSYHLMPVYGCPQLLDGFPNLKARMQGKSCFNFKSHDQALFKDLEQLTVKSFSTF